MWWVLSALLILIAWALWFILEDLALWIPITISAVIVVALITMVVVRKILARRAASALEKAIAQQGAQQAQSARPERRAEIQELQKQIGGGISALKSSRLGSGKARGAAALYSLPWYMIIGPPGAGKTTALKHSGLHFPVTDPTGTGGAVRGVGGTRNCDWWFTNEAILLDTAGRYTTESDDRDEWLAFLGMLLKYRSKRPINGVLVAISITDLIDANDQQIESTGKKLRGRIDEIMTQLHMVVPVYVLFTKVDLVAGFSEFFGDLRKSDRAQAWGATLKLAEPKTEPGRLFDAEFDTLVKALHQRSLKRLAMERNREARERIYQFPLEFAGLRRNLSELMSVTFQVNAFQGTPLLRGFYFTSGTQEGRPLDRVLGRMGQAMGIRMPDEEAPKVVESKSYFLHDVFMNVVFPDGELAARSASEIRRQKVMRLAVSAAAMVLGGIIATPGVVSYLNNQELVEETEARAKEAAKIDWDDGEPPTEKLEKLNPVLARLLELDQHKDEIPTGYGWLMYSGEELYRPTVALYVSSLQKGFVVPCKTRLEEQLQIATGEKYLEVRLQLKTYLMLSDIEHLDVDWATGQLTTLWAEILAPTSDVGKSDLVHMLNGHVAYYLQLLKDEKVRPLERDEELVEEVRETLQKVPVPKRYYEQFVNVLRYEKYDPAGDNRKSNMMFPPETLKTMFADRPDVLEKLKSKKYEAEKVWQEAEGPYTDKGHYAVLINVKEGEDFLNRESWVVPLTKKELKIPQNLKALAQQYETTYVQQWDDLLNDIQVVQPTTIEEAIELYEILSKAPWPYLKIAHRVEDHCLWKSKNPLQDNQNLSREVNRRINSFASRHARGLRLGIKVEKIQGRSSIVPGKFEEFVRFSVAGKGGSQSKTNLSRYVDVLGKLRNKMLQLQGASDDPDPKALGEHFEDARKKTEELIETLRHERTKKVMRNLMLTPLYIGERPELSAPGEIKGPKPPPGKKGPAIPKGTKDAILGTK